jgi:peptide/nickel transport system substrate-binding protein
MKDKDGVQLPYLDKVTFKPIPEVAQRVNALETGQIDIMHTSDTEQLAKRLRPDKAAGKINILESDKFAEVGYTMLNSSKPPFDNIHARRAIAFASDAQLLIKTRGGGIGTIASGPFAPGVDGYLKDTGVPTFDLTKAKAELALYKKDTGKDLTFAYTTVGIDSALLTVQEIQTQMAAAGIKMTIAPAADQATTINKALSHDFQAIGWRNHPGADPDTQYMWWYSKSALNFGSIKDPELDRLLDAGRSETDPAKRLQDYQAVNKLFAANVYNLWGPWALWSIASSPKVNGILGPTMSVGGNFPGLGSGHFMTGVWLSK